MTSDRRERSPEKPGNSGDDTAATSNANVNTSNVAAIMGIASTTESQAAAESTNGLDELLKQLKTKFTAVSDDMLSKMDDMSRRLDNLEAQLRVDGTQTEGKS